MADNQLRFIGMADGAAYPVVRTAQKSESCSTLQQPL
jgi:hypothetical protein